jgi:DNA-binding IclR family transcriptional regulator
MDPARQVKTTKTSMRIVEEIRRQNGATLAELTTALNYSRTTLYNHLVTLQEEKLLTKHEDQFHVGLHFLELGEYARNRRQEYSPAKVQVYRLAEATNEEAVFAVQENGLMYSIEYVMGDANPSNPEVGSEFIKVGSTYNMHNSATGKAVLSQLSMEKINSIIEQYDLPKTTERTITDKSELLVELERIDERGYAMNDEELQRGYRSIAVPVVINSGELIGALSVGGPAYRFELSKPRIDNIVDKLSTSVENIRRTIDKDNE